MNDEDFKKLMAGYRPPFSQAMEEFCLEQSRKYWSEFQDWSTDDLNRLLVQLFDKDAAPHEVHLPDGSNFVGCSSGKIIALYYYLQLFMRAQGSLLPGRKPTVSAALRLMDGENIGRTYRENQDA
jgi:hypothetical protein